ncbi:HDIG domain-containing protein [Romboutsia weinsteinii]|uniref:HDIG domain-containing protein n=1 Tax=Romboutsia weinsteinii TaxID=2020949 RepID=A0A371J6J6_9FIRM|nr:HD domain-containing protein [Romboutsia weinsteinii]RDY28379.1 HDIG domain-containing protein [Romboutsia weinsteinii]
MNNIDTFNKVEKILLESKKPSKEIQELIREGKFNNDPFNIIVKLSSIEQNPKYHPEGNVLNHVLMVIDEASKRKDYSKDKRAFMWGALLHDIGKLTTTRIRKNRITSYNHDIEGEKMALSFLSNFTEDIVFKNKVSKLVRYHMQPLFFDKNLPFFKNKEMLEEVDYKEVALLSISDRLGRGNISNEDINNEKEKIEKFKEYCRSNT